MNRKMLAPFGVKWNPFAQEIPVEGLYVSPIVEAYLWRVENSLIREGGFTQITGLPGSGKSAILRLIDDRVRRVPDIVVGTLTRTSSGVADIYRELGEIFGVDLRPHNRWCGFKSLRERWQAHIEATLVRPVLLIDEAQALAPIVLNELRLLSSTKLDSRVILTVILAGDERLRTRMRAHPDLLPVESRLRLKLHLEPLSAEELTAHLKHLLAAAGNARLMTPELIGAVCDHALGNLRALTSMCAELLLAAAQKELPQLDEKLYLEMTSRTRPKLLPAERRKVATAAR